MSTGGGAEQLATVLRRTQYRLEVAENASAGMLARSQRQGAALDAARTREAIHQTLYGCPQTCT